MSIAKIQSVWGSRRKGNLGSRHDKVARLLMLALADNANDEGFCWPSREELAFKCQTDERSIRRLIHDRLVPSGELYVEVKGRGPKDPNLYLVTLDMSYDEIVEALKKYFGHTPEDAAREAETIITLRDNTDKTLDEVSRILVKQLQYLPMKAKVVANSAIEIRDRMLEMRKGDILSENDDDGYEPLKKGDSLSENEDMEDSMSDKGDILSEKPDRESSKPSLIVNEPSGKRNGLGENNNGQENPSYYPVDEDGTPLDDGGFDDFMVSVYHCCSNAQKLPYKTPIGKTRVRLQRVYDRAVADNTFARFVAHQCEWNKQRESRYSLSALLAFLTDPYFSEWQETQKHQAKADDTKNLTGEALALSNQFVNLTGIARYKTKEWDAAIREMITLFNGQAQTLLEQAWEEAQGWPEGMIPTGPWALTKTMVRLSHQNEVGANASTPLSPEKAEAALYMLRQAQNDPGLRAD